METDPLLTFARELCRHADQEQGERERRDAQFRRDLQQLPLDVQLHLLRMMVRRVFGRNQPTD